MEWKESKTDCPGVILWGMRLRRNCWNISMNRNSYPLKYQSLSLSCSHGFKRQHCMWVVSTINHGPHHKNKCCTSAGDGQQRDITMVFFTLMLIGINHHFARCLRLPIKEFNMRKFVGNICSLTSCLFVHSFNKHWRSSSWLHLTK